jgi:hypothetical protein
MATEHTKFRVGHPGKRFLSMVVSTSVGATLQRGPAAIDPRHRGARGSPWGVAGQHALYPASKPPTSMEWRTNQEATGHAERRIAASRTRR